MLKLRMLQFLLVKEFQLKTLILVQLENYFGLDQRHGEITKFVQLVEIF